MNRRSFLLWSIAAAFPPATVFAQTAVSNAEAEVYTALLNRATEDLNKADLAPIVVASDTVSLKDSLTHLNSGESGKSLVESIAQRVPEASRAAIDKLLRLGDTPRMVRLKMNAVRHGLKVHVVPEAKLREIFDNDDRLGNQWQRFRTAYAGAAAILRFSRVGWDPASSHALVFLETACGALCGSGHLVLLKREWGIWNIVKSHRIWVA